MMYIELTPFEENLQYILNNNVPSSESSILAHAGAPEETTATQLRQPTQLGSATDRCVAGTKVRIPDLKILNHTPVEVSAEEEEECYELIDVINEESVIENRPNGYTHQSTPINSHTDPQTIEDIVIEIEQGEEENCYIIKCPSKSTQSSNCSFSNKAFDSWKLPYLRQAQETPRARRPVPAAIPINASLHLLQRGKRSEYRVRNSHNFLPLRRSNSRSSGCSSTYGLGEYGSHLNEHNSRSGYQSEAEYNPDYPSEDELDHEQRSQMGIDIVARLRRLLNFHSDSNSNTQEAEQSRKRRSGYWDSDVNPTQIKYRKVQNRFPKVITHKLDDDDVEMIPSSFPKREKPILLEKPICSSINSIQMTQRKSTQPVVSVGKPKSRKSMFASPPITHNLVKNTSYADVEFSDDDEPELVQGFGIGGRTVGSGMRKPTVYNIPIRHLDEDCVSVSSKPPPPLIETRSGSILATSLMPDSKGKPLCSAETMRENFHAGVYGNPLGRRSASSCSSSGASTSASLIGLNGLSHMRSNLWSTNARSILTQEKETEEHEKYQQLLEQVVPCLYAADAGNTRQAVKNTLSLEGSQRRSALFTGINTFGCRNSAKVANRKSLNEQSNSQQLKRPPLSSTINVDADEDEEDVTFTGVVQLKDRSAKNVASTVVIDDDDDISEIIDLREDEQRVVSTCTKIQEGSGVRSSPGKNERKAEIQLPYVEPVNTLQERFKTSPHLRSNWLATQQTKWIEKRKNLFLEVKDTMNTVEKLTAERRAAELEMQERLRRIQIVDPELLVIDDFPEPCGEEEPEFVELTAEHQARIKAAIYGAPDEVLISKFNLNITRRDIHTLLGHNWLNDEVINFYMNLLTERGEKKNESHGLPLVYAMNTFFVPRLLSAGHSGVKRWTRKVDIFSKDIIPVPVHVGGVHWCMAIIHLRNRTIKYYDSMGTPNNSVLKALEKYLKDESMDKRKQPFDTSKFEIESVRDVPRQMNGSDCGVFSCMFAEYITRNKGITFSQQHMEYFRHKMILEIVQGELLQ